jgi:hypothetical protein
MAVPYKTTIKTTGPFFKGDPLKKWADNKQAFMARWAEMGEADVRGRLIAGQSRRAPLRGITPNRVSGHVVGRVRSLSGKDWRATAVVSINNRGFSTAQGVRLMAAAAYLERTGHALRRAKGALRRAKAVNIDMLKGLR